MNTDQDFISRCRELYHDQTPWPAARFILWSEGYGSYEEIKRRLERLNPISTEQASGKGE